MRAIVALLAALTVLAPVATRAEGGATPPSVEPRVAPTGEAIAVPEAPPPAAEAKAIESSVEREIREAEKAAQEAERDIKGGATGIPSQSLEPSSSGSGAGN